MNKTLKWTLISITTVMGLFLAMDYYVGVGLDISPEIEYSKQDLINHCTSKHMDLYELRDYYNTLVPEGKIVDIEFQNKREIARLEVINADFRSQPEASQHFLNWDLDVSSSQLDSILTVLSWTRETLAEIKLRLDRANCISIENGEPTRIGYQRSGMGMYFYNLFSGPASDSIRSVFNKTCTHVMYNDSVVLEYSGGAIGPQCFPGR